MKTAIYPGSFDPMTYGHVDIASRAALIFDKIYFVVASNYEKNCLFSLDERIEIAKEVFKDNPKIEVVKGEGLIAKQAQKLNAKAIIRGLRMVTDYEYEVQFSQVCSYLAPDIEIVFLFAKQEFSFVSSTRVKEIFSLGGDVSNLVPIPVLKAMEEKFKK